MSDHAKMITITQGASKTKEVTSAGVGDTKNDNMLYSIVEAENHDAATKAFRPGAEHRHDSIHAV